MGGTVLRLASEGYLHVILWRHIDEDELSPREREAIQLTKDELREMAAPMAVTVSKTKLGRKHGRSVIAAADSYESLVDLFIWARRVNKIARKYRKAPTGTPEEFIQGQAEDVNNGPVPGSNGSAPVPNIVGIVTGTGG